MSNKLASFVPALNAFALNAYTPYDSRLLREVPVSLPTIKSVCYGRFMANIPFDNSCNETTLQSLNTVIRQLTYKELCLIRLLYHREIVSTNSLEAYLRNTHDMEGTVLFHQLLHLRNLGILITLPPFHVGTALGNVRISILGMHLYEMMELNLIPEEDLSSLKAVISKVGQN